MEYSTIITISNDIINGDLVILNNSHFVNNINSLKNKYFPKMDYCTQDCVNLIGDFDSEKTCQFTRDNCEQEAIDFIITYFCVFRNSFLVILIFGVRPLIHY